MTTHARWFNASNGRYYVAQAQQDLFDDWTVTLHWGRQGTRLGRHKIIYCADIAGAQSYLTNLERVRLKRGYQKIIL